MPMRHLLLEVDGNALNRRTLMTLVTEALLKTGAFAEVKSLELEDVLFEYRIGANIHRATDIEEMDLSTIDEGHTVSVGALVKTED